ncbi:MAG TPA: hypothetical protein VEL48_01925, partial [Candidatus Acidoferrales bacterium]|nr:hypothetical protein [Candidatus Acidoferrales bacterium]
PSAAAGAIKAVSNDARIKIQREEPPHVTGGRDSALTAALYRMAAEYISTSRDVMTSPNRVTSSYPVESTGPLMFRSVSFHAKSVVWAT